MIEIERDAEKITARPVDDIVSSKASQFREELRRLVQESPEEIIIDLSKVNMIDSVGIGVIIATYNNLSRSNAKLTIINTTKTIHHLFKVMHLDRHFTIQQAENSDLGDE